MSIPLVQEATKDAINTSIIAIKRNIERINMLLGLSNSEEIDTSEFVKKSDIVDVVEADNMNPVTSNAVVPVDEVTLGNMQSVTSNAVAKSLGTHYSYEEKVAGSYFGAVLYTTTVLVDMNGTTSGQSVAYTLPSEFDNYIIVRLVPTVSRNNFSLIGTQAGAWMPDSRRSMRVQQNLSNITTGMYVFVDIYYVKTT